MGRWIDIILTTGVLLIWALNWADEATLFPAWLNYTVALFLWAGISLEVALYRLQKVRA